MTREDKFNVLLKAYPKQKSLIEKLNRQGRTVLETLDIVYNVEQREDALWGKEHRTTLQESSICRNADELLTEMISAINDFRKI